jgi:hypothetical protein
VGQADSLDCPSGQPLSAIDAHITISMSCLGQVWWQPISTHDGLMDLFVANVDQEMFSLYPNMKDETFREVARANGVSRSPGYSDRRYWLEPRYC